MGLHALKQRDLPYEHHNRCAPTETTIQTEASPKKSYDLLTTTNSMPSPIATATCREATSSHMRPPGACTGRFVHCNTS